MYKRQLYSGAGQLSANSSTLNSGASKLASGTQSLVSGAQTLASGTGSLVSVSYTHLDVYKRQTVKDACELAQKLEAENLILYHTEDKNISRRKELYTEEGLSLIHILFFQNSIDLYLTYSFLHYTFDNMEQSN